MTGQKRRRHNPDFKAKVALDAIKGSKTAAQLASEHQVSSVQVSQWKKQLMSGLPDIFGKVSNGKPGDTEALTAPLYQEIGKLKMEVDWLKKKETGAIPLIEKRRMVESQHPDISARRQCELLGLNRATFYRSIPMGIESPENLNFMRLIDEE